jgi:hypothetical protein
VNVPHSSTITAPLGEFSFMRSITGAIIVFADSPIVFGGVVVVRDLQAASREVMPAPPLILPLSQCRSDCDHDAQRPPEAYSANPVERGNSLPGPCTRRRIGPS